ncbi:hypothetical protein BO83DRAFT_340190 [Aspergillus eucalypticola CBS 122712]|uniref:Uncharacterized protein n=1 Tax=Aspergillus eucalypticola (strain CBS 122712 / IBT 29274) TaxID=1448314 RepID=A0A317VFI6_ASPEC|nr:uncharacterized protein BO83DRAFT_340190 [Aspergillus eucalypticola CBS 122712]PWY70640.1 hypothetical protein BO83DRAFT_340190 [Aspergillus eucalypticola CBS 122712]
MTWFTGARDTSDKGWHFDAVSLLAVIGESIIERQKHLIVASPFSVLPRLLPAPQAILNTDSTTQLPPFENVSVTSLYSEITANQLGYFAGLIHSVDKLEPFDFRVYCIRHSERYITEANSDRLKNYHKPTRTRIGLKLLCPMNILTLASVLWTIGLAVWSIVLHDGVGLLAIITMSISSSLSCLSQQLYPELEKTSRHTNDSKGDLVINTRNGAFIVVQCTVDIARELYLEQERYRYTLRPDATLFKVLMGASTILLMVSVLLSSNCGWTMQTAIAVTYILLNLCYWALPVLFDARLFWDVAALYEVEVKNQRCNDNYTVALWNAIQETGEVGWVRTAHLLPDSEVWDHWLEEAKENIDNKHWDPEESKDRWMTAAL